MIKWISTGGYIGAFCMSCPSAMFKDDSKLINGRYYPCLLLADENTSLPDVIKVAERHKMDNPSHIISVTLDADWELDVVTP